MLDLTLVLIAAAIFVRICVTIALSTAGEDHPPIYSEIVASYPCIGGPFDGQRLSLPDGARSMTCVFGESGEMVGAYHRQDGTLTFLPAKCEPRSREPKDPPEPEDESPASTSP